MSSEKYWMLKMIRMLALLLAATLTACAAAQPETTKVYISDGSKQCFAKSIPISEHLALLTNNKINANNSFCAELHGMSYMAVCGGATGKIHVFDIDISDLANAKALGFKEANKLRSTVTIQPRECPKGAKLPAEKTTTSLF